MRLKAPAIVAAGCAVGVLAASPSHASTFITLQAHAKRADAPCADYHRKAAKLPRVQLSNFPGVVKLAHAALAIVAVDHRRLRAIPAASSHAEASGPARGAWRRSPGVPCSQK